MARDTAQDMAQHQARHDHETLGRDASVEHVKQGTRRTPLILAITTIPGLPAYVAEFIGTFGLVFAGCGAIMIDTRAGR
jgi:hypothetical protein